jgi:hypothetical protein
LGWADSPCSFLCIITSLSRQPLSRALNRRTTLPTTSSFSQGMRKRPRPLCSAAPATLSCPRTPRTKAPLGGFAVNPQRFNPHSQAAQFNELYPKCSRCRLRAASPPCVSTSDTILFVMIHKKGRGCRNGSVTLQNIWRRLLHAIWRGDCRASGTAARRVLLTSTLPDFSGPI